MNGCQTLSSISPISVDTWVIMRDRCWSLLPYLPVRLQGESTLACPCSPCLPIRKAGGYLAVCRKHSKGKRGGGRGPVKCVTGTCHNPFQCSLQGANSTITREGQWVRQWSAWCHWVNLSSRSSSFVRPIKATKWMLKTRRTRVLVSESLVRIPCLCYMNLSSENLWKNAPIMISVMSPHYWEDCHFRRLDWFALQCGHISRSSLRYGFNLNKHYAFSLISFFQLQPFWSLIRRVGEEAS